MFERELLEKIKETIKHQKYNYQTYYDLYAIAHENLEADEIEVTKYLKWLSERIEWVFQNEKLSDEEVSKLYELHKRVLLAGAKNDFEMYLLYVEWDRDVKKSFYPPRRKALKPVVDALQELHDTNLELLCISLPPGVGKLLADDTPIMTRNGWKNHGDLVVGDEVIGIDGEFKKVERVFPKNVANYEVTFTNGDKIKCHANHEWFVYNTHKTRYDLLSTKEMLEQGIDSGEPNKRGHRYNFKLPEHGYMKGTYQELPLDPYLFGVWLGDGCTNKGDVTICNTDNVILNEFMEKGYGLRCFFIQVGCTRYTLDRLRDDLHKMGMCYTHRTVEKYVPMEYLIADKNQRLELLAGLIDTDGTLNRGNRYFISTTNESIRDAVCTLVSSFNWRYSLKVDEPKLSSSNIQGKKPIYTISFHPDLFIPCRVSRKRMSKPALRRRVSIASIKPIEPVQGNCIQVEGGIYLAGKSMLPTHNSTLATFYLTWIAGKYPNEPSLIGSHSNSFIRGMYDECLRIIQGNGEYLWGDVFPGIRIANTNAKECRIDLDRKQRFETLEFTSIGSGNAGLYRASRLLYCDDLVSGLEVALSEERLQKLWDTYTTDLRQRMIGDHCKQIMIATRWSVRDPIGRLYSMYGTSGKAKFLSYPAVDTDDESNFAYPYGVGFSTQFYHEQREIMDEVSWRALYMNEPIERSGLLYPREELRRYFDLPDRDPDAVFAVCDTKDRGKDYCVMPIIYQYGADFYVEDIICDNNTPEIVEPRLANALMSHKVKIAQFESNSAGGRIAKEVQDMLKLKGGMTKITTKFSSANKETRIISSSGIVKERFLFKDDSNISKEYKTALDFLCSYTMAGRNAHDDVPDAIAMSANFAETMNLAKVEVFKRPF